MPRSHRRAPPRQPSFWPRPRSLESAAPEQLPTFQGRRWVLGRRGPGEYAAKLGGGTAVPQARSKLRSPGVRERASWNRFGGYDEPLWRGAEISDRPAGGERERRVLCPEQRGRVSIDDALRD